VTRRTWTLVLSFLLVALLGLAGGAVRVPYVALGPGPTYDTLGSRDGQEIVRLDGEPEQETGGQLVMTTVSVADGITLFGALGLWVSGRYALAPREEYFPPEKTEDQVEKENVRAFEQSQSSAEVAALRYLNQHHGRNYPMVVVVGEVVEGGPSGQVLEPGDRLVAVNGRHVSQADEVRAALEATRPGDQIEVVVQRGQEPERTERITLGRSEDREQGFLGIVPIDQPQVPFDIDIALDDVGGPSAGLIFALAIVDKLTPGQLTGGMAVAGTGEIDTQGRVGPIGGVRFKMIAAKEAGAQVFLVPEGNCAEARGEVPDGLRLVRVTTLEDAVRSLEALQHGGDVPSC